MFESVAALMLVGLTAGGSPLRNLKDALRDAQDEVADSDDRCRRRLAGSFDDLLEDLDRAGEDTTKLGELRTAIDKVVREANDECESRLARKVERSLDDAKTAVGDAIEDVVGRTIVRGVRVTSLSSDPKWVRGTDNVDYYALTLNNLVVDGYKGRAMKVRVFMKPRGAERWIDWHVFQDLTSTYHSATWETLAFWYPVSKLPGAFERGLNPFSAAQQWTVMVDVLDVAANDVEPVASYTFDIDL